ncbi:hypothetical protein OS493_022988 [Desmophyllum pertusum]|uniref:Tetratricopeptide repeat protein n=1 Tax=Desmophyllum pertusum TaxID=174260 RepID=A0A9W9ZCG2_9CNID|nr:hypothetical protein OS493_022988 [Desmophyllum pertusum]
MALYHKLARAYIGINEFQEALANFQQLLKISKEIGSRAAEATAYRDISMAYSCIGLARYVRAISHLERSLQILKDIGDKREEASSYLELANAYQGIGEVDKVLHLLLQVTRNVTVQGDLGNIGVCYNNIGTAYQINKADSMRH